MKTMIALAGMAALLLGFAGSTPAAPKPDCVPYEVVYTGPGGHSFGAYGNVNALHAASRTLVLLNNEPLQTVSWNVFAFAGGNSVNSIAGTATFKVNVCVAKAPDMNLYKDSAQDQFVRRLEKLAQTGATAENDFRKVKAGQTDPKVGRKDIRVTVNPL